MDESRVGVQRPLVANARLLEELASLGEILIG
jgi:hypothetical protein